VTGQRRRAEEEQVQDAAQRNRAGARLPAAPADGGRGEREDPQAGYTGWLRMDMTPPWTTRKAA